MYIKYSTGFLVASIVQAATIMLSEKFHISSLGANIKLTQLLIHILSGQVAGYLLLYIMRNMKAISKNSLWTIGITYGAIVWVVLLSINSAIGKVNAPWKQGFPTVISSLAAFLFFGLIAAYTIKEADVKNLERE